MRLLIRNMNEKFAKQIGNWRYPAPYDFYNIELDQETLKELLENDYYTVLDHDEELVGFFCIGSSAKVPIGAEFGAYSEELIDVGIGMKPELTGQGYGSTFFSCILAYIREQFQDVPLRLTVAKFNTRAIHLYKKLGFVKKTEFQRGSTVFITMVRAG